MEVKAKPRPTEHRRATPYPRKPPRGTHRRGTPRLRTTQTAAATRGHRKGMRTRRRGDAGLWGAGAAIWAAALWVLASCASSGTVVGPAVLSGEDSAVGIAEDAVAITEDAGVVTGPSCMSAPACLPCRSAADCLPGQVCCGEGPPMAPTGSTICEMGPCPPVMGFGPVQICATSAECGAGKTCGVPSQPLPIGALLECSGSPDAGANVESGTTDDGSGPADGSRAEPSDAADSPSTEVGAGNGD
jgi:hypothetical protein